MPTKFELAYNSILARTDNLLAICCMTLKSMFIHADRIHIKRITVHR